MSILITAAGWLGGLAIVAGYLMLLAKRTHPDARTFLMLNTVGGGLLTASALYAGAWPNTVINLMWLLSGLYALCVKGTNQAPPRSPAEGTLDDAAPEPELVGASRDLTYS
jgi:hypothetical protein